MTAASLVRLVEMLAELTDEDRECIAQAVRSYDLDEITYDRINTGHPRMHVGPSNACGVAHVVIQELIVRLKARKEQAG